MKQILPIIQANLRKGISQAISLLVFALIAALLMNIGLLMMSGYGDFFDQRTEALHAPHYALVEEERLFSQSQLDYLKNYPGVTEVEHESVISFQASINYSSGKMPSFFIFLDASKTRAMNDLTLVEGKSPSSNNDICLPLMFKSGGGYQLGNSFSLDVGNQKITYTICGFTEEIMFGSPNNSIHQVYLSKAGHAALADRMPNSECVVIRARLQNPSDSDVLYHDCIKEFFFKTNIEEADSVYAQSLDWSIVKMVRTMISNITSIILTVFAALIVLISLLVIRFRIHNSIEEGMTNTGALKAVGYTGQQLLWAIVLQFSGIVLIGVMFGIAVSYALVPLVSHVLELQTALQWQQGFNPFSSGLTLVSILMTVFIVTWLSARRIRNLQPLAALRQGLSTHSFKKNHLPLDRSVGALSLLLAVKSAFQTKGQMVMIFIIVTVVGFAATAGLSVYINLGVHPESFAKLLGGEVPDAILVVADPNDMDEIRQSVKESEEIRKTFFYQDTNVMIGDLRVSNIIAEDFSLFEGALLYEGRYPKHANEICVSGYLAERENIGINDTIKVSLGDKTEEYLVVGFIQTMMNGGLGCTMTIPGYQLVQPDYRPRSIYVYLVDNAKTEVFLESIADKHAKELNSTINMKELMDAQLGIYGDIFFAVAVVFVVVTILVIILVLYLMLKTVILRQRRQLGIQKAMGFTTFQLMNQFTLYYIPVIALGVVAGGLLGVLGFNSLFVALTRNMGLMTASMPPSVELTILMCLGLVLLAYVFAMLISWRIRKVSAYSLISE